MVCFDCQGTQWLLLTSSFDLQDLQAHWSMLVESSYNLESLMIEQQWLSMQDLKVLNPYSLERFTTENNPSWILWTIKNYETRSINFCYHETSAMTCGSDDGRNDGVHHACSRKSHWRAHHKVAGCCILKTPYFVWFTVWLTTSQAPRTARMISIVHFARGTSPCSSFYRWVGCRLSILHHKDSVGWYVNLLDPCLQKGSQLHQRSTDPKIFLVFKQLTIQGLT